MPTDRLDRLIDAVGELVVANSMVARDLSDAGHTGEALRQHADHLGKIVRDLQQLAMSLRTVPVGNVMRKMGRLVRDLAQQTGKTIELQLSGAETEIDRQVVEALVDPLVHMVRNAIDHGIEPGDVREAAGKPRAGRLTLTAEHREGGVRIELADDGRGLDRPRVLAKAWAAGLVAAGVTPADAEIDELIFAPGLSTAEAVTGLSGRGVGMDVVRRNVEGLRGRVLVRTEPGRGSTFTIRLPLTLSVIDGLAVQVGGQTYVLPVTNVIRAVRPAGLVHTVRGRAEAFDDGGRLVPLVRLARAFGVPENGDCDGDDDGGAMAVVVQDGGHRAAVLVDALAGQTQVVVKPLDGLGRLAGVSGAAVLGDGRVALVLDVAGVLGDPPRV